MPSTAGFWALVGLAACGDPSAAGGDGASPYGAAVKPPEVVDGPYVSNDQKANTTDNIKGKGGSIEHVGKSNIAAAEPTTQQS